MQLRKWYNLCKTSTSFTLKTMMPQGEERINMIKKATAWTLLISICAIILVGCQPAVPDEIVQIELPGAGEAPAESESGLIDENNDSYLTVIGFSEPVPVITPEPQISTEPIVASISDGSGEATEPVPTSTPKPTKKPAATESPTPVQAASPSPTPSPTPLPSNSHAANTPVPTAAPTVEPTIEPTTAPQYRKTIKGAGNQHSFTAQTLSGATINSSSLFASADITMINVWTTYCNPCIREMPELGALASKYSDNGVQILGIVCDVNDANDALGETARAIVSQCNANYPHMILSESLKGDILRGISSVPTTMFFDNEGRYLCSNIVGAKSYDGWAKVLDDLLGKAEAYAELPAPTPTPCFGPV